MRHADISARICKHKAEATFCAPLIGVNISNKLSSICVRQDWYMLISIGVLAPLTKLVSESCVLSEIEAFSPQDDALSVLSAFAFGQNGNLLFG